MRSELNIGLYDSLEIELKVALKRIRKFATSMAKIKSSPKTRKSRLRYAVSRLSSRPFEWRRYLMLAYGSESDLNRVGLDTNHLTLLRRRER